MLNVKLHSRPFNQHLFFGAVVVIDNGFDVFAHARKVVEDNGIFAGAFLAGFDFLVKTQPLHTIVVVNLVGIVVVNAEMSSSG